MADEKDFLQTQCLLESIYMLRIPFNLLLPLAFRFSMARKLDDDRIKFLLKETLLIAPGVLPSPCSMDEENGLPSL